MSKAGNVIISTFWWCLFYSLSFVNSSCLLRFLKVTLVKSRGFTTWLFDAFFDIYIPVCMLDLYDRRHLPPVRQVDSNSRLICLTCSHNSRKRNGARIMFRHFPTRPNLNRDLDKARTHVTPIDSRSEIAKHPSEILLTLLTILVFSRSFSWLMANDKRKRGKGLGFYVARRALRDPFPLCVRFCLCE